MYYVLNYRPRLRFGAIAVALGVALWSARQPAALLEVVKNPSQELFVAALFAAVLIALRSRDVQLSVAWWTQPLMVCGGMCYSLYLIHLPIALLAKSVLMAIDAPAMLWHPVVTVTGCGVVSLAVAWQFHLHVERRFMPRATSSRPIRDPVMTGLASRTAEAAREADRESVMG